MPTMQCPAKINLFLEVIQKRPDGYHDLESVFLAVDLTDSLSAEAMDDGRITMECSDPSVPTGNDNILVRAAQKLQERHHVRQGIRFYLEKRIPMGGGLGGGSSDAAGALHLANQLWDLQLAPVQLAETGMLVGSDVPFFCHGGAALCKGRGEIVTPLEPPTADIPLTLVLSSLHSNTASAYAQLQLPEPAGVRSAAPCIAALRTSGPHALEAAAFNRFEPSVFAALPDLGILHARLSAALNKPVRMSGSGAALWYIGSAEEAERAIANNAELRHLAQKLHVRYVSVTAYHAP